MSLTDLSIRTFAGEELTQLIPALAELRIQVFAAYPYLYAGTVAYEKKYLLGFASAPDAVVVAASDAAGRIVGCATGSALTGHHAEFSAPLAAAGYDLASTFYFGESVLDPVWRGRGVGHAFFDARERHAMECGYARACFCAVIREDDDKRKPADYSALDGFWQKRGFQRLPEVEAFYDWPEVADGPSLPHPMAYWMKEI